MDVNVRCIDPYTTQISIETQTFDVVRGVARVPAVLAAGLSHLKHLYRIEPIPVEPPQVQYQSDVYRRRWDGQPKTLQDQTGVQGAGSASGALSGVDALVGSAGTGGDEAAGDTPPDATESDLEDQRGSSISGAASGSESAQGSTITGAAGGADPDLDPDAKTDPDPDPDPDAKADPEVKIKAPVPPARSGRK